MSFSCGTIWLENISSEKQESVLLGLAYMNDFLGQELKPSCINAVAHLLIPWRESLSMQPALFNDALDKAGPRVTEFLAFGDAGGNLVLCKNREAVFHD